jgi:hypothetical protein
MKTKGEFMKAVYSAQELKNIDSAVPIDQWDSHNPLYHVMNFNDAGAFGRLENLFDIAQGKGVDVSGFEHFRNPETVN